jgi:hypothetical protein
MYIGLLALTGCSTGAFEEESTATPVVPVDQIINSLKCGLARAVAEDVGNRAGLLGATAKINLAVNVVQGTNVTAGGEAISGIPVFQGASLLPSLSFSSTRQRTINSFFNVNITAVDRSTGICRDGEPYRDAGFSTWMQSIARGINLARAGGPRAEIVDYSYESDFIVKSGVSGSLGITVAPIKFTGSGGYDRTDVQHIKVTLAAVSEVVDKKTGKVVRESHGEPFFIAPKTFQTLDIKPVWSHGDFGLVPSK